MAAKLCSRVGPDDRGRYLCGYFAWSGVDVSLLQTDLSAPTGAVQVTDNAKGPGFEIAPHSAWDFIEARSAEIAAARGAACVVFGTLAQRHPVSRCSIRLLVNEARRAGAVRFADLNLRSPFYDSETVLWTLRSADVVKMNLDELRTVSGLLGARGEEARLFTGLLREFDIPCGVLTAGSDGAWIFENQKVTHIPAHPATLVDAVGAGDAFAAILLWGLAKGRSLVESAPRAARLAACVVSRIGATPAWNDDLRRSLDD